LFIRRVRPRAASTIKKSRAAACRASREQRFKANWQNFAQKKEQKIKMYQGTDFDVKIAK